MSQELHQEVEPEVEETKIEEQANIPELEQKQAEPEQLEAESVHDPTQEVITPWNDPNGRVIITENSICITGSPSSIKWFIDKGNEIMKMHRKRG